MFIVLKNTTAGLLSAIVPLEFIDVHIVYLAVHIKLEILHLILIKRLRSDMGEEIALFLWAATRNRKTVS